MSAPEGKSADKAVRDEIGLLFPDVDLEVRDPDTGESVPVTVRAFRFLEALRAQPLAAPFTDALAAAAGADGVPDLADIAAVQAEHAERWVGLVALACDRSEAWLQRLAEDDGDALSEAMWQANRDFFTRRAVAAIAAARKAPGTDRGESGSR
ncbi:MAG: hypothetical protein OXH64_00070 [Rhodospirillaceae bacterium]|nr:hypothetical protein [Rhodospirillaceae bacterium]